MGMVHLPNNSALPIHFQCRATHVRRSAHVAVVWNLPVVEERPAFGEIPGLARRVRHIPCVYDISGHIDQVDRLVRRWQRAEQRETGKSAFRIMAAKPGTAALYRGRLYR